MHPLDPCREMRERNQLPVQTRCYISASCSAVSNAPRLMEQPEVGPLLASSLSTRCAGSDMVGCQATQCQCEADCPSVMGVSVGYLVGSIRCGEAWFFGGV